MSYVIDYDKSNPKSINDGSHMITDDLFIDPYTDSIERYKEIFKQIFVKTGKIGRASCRERV